MPTVPIEGNSGGSSSGTRGPHRVRRGVLSALSIGLAAGIIWALPALLRTGWDEIGSEFARLTWYQVAVLLVLWLAGLWCYTYTLKATLPGLTNLQAFTMNACSSGIGNLLPFGGAVGVAVNFALGRSWGYQRRAVAASVLVSGILNVLIRLSMPAIGLLALLLAGRVPSTALAIPTGIAAVGIVALVALVIAALRWDRAAAMVGRLADRAAAALPRRVRPAPHRFSTALLRTRTTVSDLIAQRWAVMSGSIVLYFGLQAALFTACLLVTGAYIGLAEAVAAFALGRLLTAMVVTPGGTGFTEAGTAALLVSFGAAIAPTALAVLLFSTLVFVLEIPLGALLWVLSTFLTRGRWSPAATRARLDGRAVTRAQR